ncbi:DUF1543 domain-containing protein [Sphingobacterium sp. DK4209]|uniref:DUF1543 domain-containing protein n=1 Tax=Sphingobacterium zhuxiongii TaxID=2662364 RepID=A0A5Q0QFT3_9SPHI|nr:MULTISPECIES: DUF1543 domain-containing protein [unclassified Sphingobacterium]MVZ65122.1 DUF1543 domain-containing protein [Sphingobacterium sp. DK4209]QGA26070.1 DUF1543 domain-containing protein [Sphingobacterium sp. dk4302]
MNLYMLVLGGKPAGRFTEQHDVFFGIANELKDLVPQMNEFWPELADRMHIDSWRKVTRVGNFQVDVIEKVADSVPHDVNLFFVNLGGYKPNDMEEYHYKILVVAQDLAEASKVAKESTFYKHYESSHIDDKYGIDVDDIYPIEDMLPASFKESYQLVFRIAEDSFEDLLEVGYLKISKLLAT